MRRAEAEQLIGQCVRAWTSANGVYIGTLEAVKGSPWRGIVLVSGVLEPACVYELHRPGRPRRGFRPGDRLEVGGINISPADPSAGITYLEALRNQLAQFQDWAVRADIKLRDRAWLPIAIERLGAAIAEEENRTLTRQPADGPADSTQNLRNEGA